MYSLLLSLTLAAAAPVEVAVTLDDLPFAGEVGPQDSKEAATDRILAALKTHAAPVAGFVNCGRAESKEALFSLLRRWQAAGADLGNHTHSHQGVDRSELSAWLDDVRQCDGPLVELLGRPVTFFRYPFLQEGRTPAKREAAAAALRKQGYQIAQVSIDTSDWALAEPYVQALARGDAVEAEAIGRSYVAHLVAAARHYRQEARHQLGHDIKHVVLLHANALCADWLGRGLEALEDDKFRFITLSQALKDPIYQQPEQYTGAIGLSWLYRIAPKAAERWQWDDRQTDVLRLRHGGETLRINDELTIRAVAAKTFVVVHQVPHPANSLVAEMPDGTLLFVGSPYDPASTTAVIAWLKERFPDRKLAAIDTHFHFDGGSGGNAAFLAAHASVFGSDLTAKLIRERGEKLRAGMVAAVADEPSLKARFEGFLPAPPRQVFPLAKGLTLTFGSEEVQVRFPGRAHSPDNVVVWFPSRHLLFGGCAVVAMPKMGYLGDADLGSWPSALEAMRALRPQLIVPGHDAPGDVRLLDHTLALVQGVVARTQDR